jgi:hypothetical protein
MNLGSSERTVKVGNEMSQSLRHRKSANAKIGSEKILMCVLHIKGIYYEFVSPKQTA